MVMFFSPVSTICHFYTYFINPNRTQKNDTPVFMEGKEEEKEGRERKKEIKIILVLSTPWELLFSKHQ